MARVVIPGFRKIEVSGGGEGGTSNYNDLTNKPFINNVPLVGNLNTVDLKLTDATLTEEGVPAEAKTVGEKLDNINSNLAPTVFASAGTPSSVNVASVSFKSTVLRFPTKGTLLIDGLFVKSL